MISGFIKIEGHFRSFMKLKNNKNPAPWIRKRNDSFSISTSSYKLSLFASFLCNKLLKIHLSFFLRLKNHKNRSRINVYSQAIFLQKLSFERKMVKVLNTNGILTLSEFVHAFRHGSIAEQIQDEKEKCSYTGYLGCPQEWLPCLKWA